MLKRRSAARMIACLKTMAETDYDVESAEFADELEKRVPQVEKEIIDAANEAPDDDEEENSGIIGKIKTKLHLGSNDDDEDDDE